MLKKDLTRNRWVSMREISWFACKLIFFGTPTVAAIASLGFLLVIFHGNQDVATFCSDVNDYIVSNLYMFIAAVFVTFGATFFADAMVTALDVRVFRKSNAVRQVRKNYGSTS